MTFVGIVDEVGTYWRQISLKKHNNSNNTRVSNSKININNFLYQTIKTADMLII